ncbi:hypothetical protein PtA15_6A97 [Puccinia triticina]|uniref:Uncharacterized protein n=1 Tax=Puccinia triticina TaxID=208348 RepID=A0ABY7CJR2_9BASI|nr:uncharacterized protein PtA15_6A97 [Puccinia triticina]WAQ85469.1 hypothetical protein PtA15_6A97 [Puccinia triticina]
MALGVAGAENRTSRRKRTRAASSEHPPAQHPPHHDHRQPMTQEKEQQQQPAKKRRKGVAGILSTALDAALFTSAIGYAAYQFWCGRTLAEDEQDPHSFVAPISPRPIPAKPSPSSPASTHAAHPAAHQILSSPPPPPYEPRQADHPAPPHPPPRRPRLRASVSRLHPASRPAPPGPPAFRPPINFVLQPSAAAAMPAPRRTANPTRHHRLPVRRHTAQIDDELMADFVCSLDPYVPPPSDPLSPEHANDPEEEDEEDDPEMRAFKAQIQGLIVQGQAALASRPPLLPPIPNSHSPLLPPSPSASPAHRRSQSHTLDPSLSLLQHALDNAASRPATNWWER